MGLHKGGLMTGGGPPTSADVLAALVGQNISANAVSLTSTAAAGITFTDVNALQRIQWGTGSFITINVASGRVIMNTGLIVTDLALGVAGSSVFASSTAPTISSGFGTSPSITGGIASCFRLNVGTGGVATAGVIGLPTAANGWNVHCANVTNPDASVTAQVSSTTNTATIRNYSRTTGLTAAWAASDIIAVIAFAF